MVVVITLLQQKPKLVSLRVQMRQQEKEKEQLNLFPLHPENENVALLFRSEAPETLNGLLEEEWTTATEGCNLSMEEEANGRWLVRKAMKRRNKEEGREERWVCYSEVTSYTYSSSTTATLSLKLDYEGVLNAWSHQRSLYVPGDTPLPHPHLHVILFPFLFLCSLISMDIYGRNLYLVLKFTYFNSQKFNLSHNLVLLHQFNSRIK